VSKHGQWPFYVLLYGGKGAALGWLHFTNASDSDLSGRVTWIKPPQAPGRLYTNGFVNETMALGSSYHRPQSATNNLLAFTNGTVAFSGGDASAPFKNHVKLGPNSLVTNLSTNGLSLKFSLRDGLWTGTVIDPATARKMSLRGAVQQKRNVGAGFFLGTSRSGDVTLQATP